jgi:hypothetical protein
MKRARFTEEQIIAVRLGQTSTGSRHQRKLVGRDQNNPFGKRRQTG